MIRIYKRGRDVLIERADEWYEVSNTDWDQFINRKGLFNYVENQLHDENLDRQYA